MKPSSAQYWYSQLPPERRTAASEQPPAAADPQSPAAPFGPAPAADPNPEAFREFRLNAAKFHLAVRRIQQEPDWPRQPADLAWELNNIAVAMHDTDPLQACRLFREALEHDGKSAAIWSNLGLAYLESGDLERAVEHFNQALAGDPGCADSWNYLALAHLEAGQYRQSWDCFSKALRCDARSPLTHNNISVLFLALNQPEPARRHCKAAITANPDCYPAHYNLGAAMTRLGRHDAAMAHYAQGSKISAKVGQPAPAAADA